MLKEIGSKDAIPQFMKDVKTSGGEVRLMGFGHRVYKNYDPRAKIMQKTTHEVLGELGRAPGGRQDRFSIGVTSRLGAPL